MMWVIFILILVNYNNWIVLVNSLVFQVTNFDAEIVTRQISVFQPFLKKYYSQQQRIRNNLSLGKLFDIASPLTHPHCLNIFDNSHQLDVAPTTLPRILRSIVPLLLKSQDRLQFLFGPANLATRNITVHKTSNFPCPFSIFFLGINIINRYSHPEILCFLLDTTLFFKYTKPYNCQIQVALYPDILYYKVSAYILVFKSNDERKLMLKFPSSSTPVIQIFVHDKSFKVLDHFRSPQAAKDLLDFVFIGDLHKVKQFCSQVFLLAFVNSGRVRKVTPDLHVIKKLDIIRICPCWISERKSRFKVPVSPPKIYLELADLTELSLPPPQFQLFWDISEASYLGENVVGHMVKYLVDCDNLQPLTSLSFLTSPVDYVANAYAHIWLSIMGNYSMIKYYENLSYRIPCSSNPGNVGQILKQRIIHVDLALVPFIRGLHLFPYFVEDELSSLTFVSCGERGFSAIAFHELSSVFDVWVWLLILVSMITLVLAINPFGKVKNHWIAPVKVILEQGTPFLESVASVGKLRFALGLFLLMGIILSNAYKNSNVYNIISPRKYLPYEYFYELVTDNFTVYTRVADMHYFHQRYQDAFMFMIEFDPFKGSIEGFSKDQLMIVAVSEVALRKRTLMKALETVPSFDVYTNSKRTEMVINKTSIVTSGILQSSIFHFSLKNLMENIWQKMTRVLNNSISLDLSREAFTKEKELLIASEAEVHFEALKDCHKVALVLPEHKCHNYSKLLNRQGFTKNVFVGKDRYIDVEWMFRITGVVPPYIPTRIKSAHEFGIWQRWTKLVGGTKEGIKGGNEKVTAAKMSGNVVVVFLIWLVGIIASFSCGAIEFTVDCLLFRIIRQRL